MRRYFRDCGWSLHVPCGDQERALKVRDAQEALANAHGHAPTAAKLAAYLELGSEEVIAALPTIQAYEAISLEAPRPARRPHGSYGDSIGCEDERYELVELDATVAAVLGHIPRA